MAGKITFTMINNGLGPSVIKDFKVYFEGNTLGSIYQKDQLSKSIENKLSVLGRLKNRHIATPAVNSAILSGSEIKLLEVVIDKHLNKVAGVSRVKHSWANMPAYEILKIYNDMAPGLRDRFLPFLSLNFLDFLLFSL